MGRLQDVYFRQAKNQRKIKKQNSGSQRDVSEETCSLSGVALFIQRTFTQEIREKFTSLVNLSRHTPIGKRIIKNGNLEDNELVDFIEWGDMASKNCFNCEASVIAIEEPELRVTAEELFNKIYENNSTVEVLLSFFHRKYVVPGQSAFIMSDMSRIKPLVNYSKDKEGFHCIIIDPPWENKSVDRKQMYPTFYMKRLFQLPVEEFLCCKKEEKSIESPLFTVVAIWVTNNPKFTNFVLNELLKRWKLEYLTKWHWLKCTDGGEPVCPLDTKHRKPYETAIIGVYNPASLPIDDTHREEIILVSTPSNIQHSRKPILKPMIDQLVENVTGIPPHNQRRLELFARNLTKGYVSWGNEVLRHQDMQAFFTRRVESQEAAKQIKDTE